MLSFPDFAPPSTLDSTERNSKKVEVFDGMF